MISQDSVTTIFALVACVISLTTWVVILLMEARNSDRNYWIIFYILLSILVTAWLAGGYFLILMGNEVETKTYFRPLLPILVALFTASGVFVYLSRLQHITIARQQVIIEQMKKRVDQLSAIESA